MRRKVYISFICALVFMFIMNTGAFALISVAPLVEGTPVSVNCKSALLLEIDSGQIIFEKNADEKRPAASVVKVMTILRCLESIENGRCGFDDKVVISKNASGMGGSQVLLDTGETQTLEILLKSAIVASANDACVAIAEHIYGSQELFVKEMNRRAEGLGMTQTNFVNCTGLPADGQYTTARDVAVMSMKLFEKEAYYKYSTVWMDELDHFDGRITSLTNTNRLIRLYDGCDGGKTGSTNEAGYCISATAKRGDMRLIAVVLGAKSGTERFDAAETMLDYGFANYRINVVAEKGTRVRGEMPVSGGKKDGISLCLDADLKLLMNKSESADTELKPSLPASVRAPVKKGQTVGSVSIYRNGRLIAEIPVVAAENVDREGFFDAWRRSWGAWIFG